MTVRPAEALPADLSGIAAGRMTFLVYRARGQAAGPWLALQGVLRRSRPGRRMAEMLGSGLGSACGADSFVILRELIAEGQGRCYLPMILGDGDARVERDDAMPAISVPLWVAVHSELRASPRLVALCETLAAKLEAEAPALAGGISE